MAHTWIMSLRDVHACPIRSCWPAHYLREADGNIICRCRVERTEARPTPRFPDVSVDLHANDEQRFAIIGRTRWALHDAGYVLESIEFWQQANACQSYSEVLRLVRNTVEVVGDA